MDNPLLIRRHLSPARRAQLDRACQSGRLTPLLPGVYTPAPTPSWDDLAWAALAARPGGALTGSSAARVSFWPERTDQVVHLAGARFKNPPDWLVASRRTIPAHLVVTEGDLRFTAAPLTILDLAREIGGLAIDEALRRRVTTLAELRVTLSAVSGQSGCHEVRRLLRDSRDQPWSELKREAHRELHRARITGWRANLATRTRLGRLYIDIAFPRERLAIEIDGWAWHSSAAALERDLRRQNALIEAGWTVLRFSQTMLPELVESVRRHQAKFRPSIRP